MSMPVREEMGVDNYLTYSTTQLLNFFKKGLFVYLLISLVVKKDFKLEAGFNF